MNDCMPDEHLWHLEGKHEDNLGNMYATWICQHCGKLENRDVHV